MLYSDDIISNRLLLRLAPDDFNQLGPLTPTHLPVGTPLSIAGQPTRQVHFLQSGLASLLTDSGGGRSSEVALIGSEGMAGWALPLGDDRDPLDCVMRIAGTSLALEAGRFVEAMAHSPALRRVMLAYSQSLTLQLASTATASANARFDGRLARWLLMAADRVGPSIIITHILLSDLLAVRRPGVTVGLQGLEEAGAIRARRGIIDIIDRERLTVLAGTSYGFAEQQYERLLGA